MFRLIGEDNKKTAELAGKALDIMRKNPDIVNASLDWPEEMPSIKLKINQDRVRELGIDNYAVSLDLYSKLSGYKVAESYQGDQLVPISFKLEGKNAAQLPDLSSMPVHVGNGRYVPLGQFADISYENEISTIWRRDLKPTITLRADCKDGVMADSLMQELYNDDFASFKASLPDDTRLKRRIRRMERQVDEVHLPGRADHDLLRSYGPHLRAGDDTQLIIAIVTGRSVSRAIWRLLITRHR